MIDTVPMVTVGLPVYNGSRYLREALDAILAQTFTDFELVISDNGSTDETRTICESYARADVRVRYHRSEVNRGAAWNFNRVLDLARGRYFKWMAYDDRCEPGLLQHAVSSLERDPSAVLCYARAALLDGDGQVIGERPYDQRAGDERPEARFRAVVHLTKTAPPVFGVVRTGILRRVGGLGPYDGSDLVLMAALVLHGRFIALPETLMAIREHAGRSVRANPSPYQMTAWFAPERAGRLMFPGWRILGEFLGAIDRAPLTLRQQARCAYELARWAKWHRTRFLDDLRVGMRHVTGRAVGALGHGSGS